LADEKSAVIFITFLLAMIGYAGMTIVILLSLKNKIPFLLWHVVTTVVLTHVIMVWTYRYGWQFSYSVRNGYSGFIIFHTALLIILISNAARKKALFLIRLSFLIVTMGAVGASFRYEIVEIYRIPVILCAATGCGGLIWNYIQNKNKNV